MPKGVRKQRDGHAAYQVEEKKSAEAMKPLTQTINFGRDKDETAVEQYDYNVVGLEKIAEKLNETQKKILNVILTDFSDDPEAENERSIFNKLKMACYRAGMNGTLGDRIKFYQTVADPQFQQVIRAVGSGIISINVIPVVAKVIQMAVEGDKTCMRWCLEMTGLKKDKFAHYSDRYQMTHNEVHIGSMNLDGKTDDELKRMLIEVEYVETPESPSN